MSVKLPCLIKFVSTVVDLQNKILTIHKVNESPTTKGSKETDSKIPYTKDENCQNSKERKAIKNNRKH